MAGGRTGASRRSASSGAPTKIIHDMIRGERYHQGRALGRGAFAVCFEVTEVSTKKKLAVKVVSKKTLNESRSKRRHLQDEITIHKSLVHPHVLHFHRCFEDEAQLYILLELCENRTLAETLRKRRRLDEKTVQYYAWQIVDGLGYIHSQQVIHRDIKPQNIFIDSQLQVKIADFGLAERLRADGSSQRSTFCGTPGFLAPELIRRKGGHSFRSDVWAMGVTLYYLLVGKMPFEGANSDAIYRRILRATSLVLIVPRAPHLPRAARSSTHALTHAHAHTWPAAGAWGTGVHARPRAHFWHVRYYHTGVRPPSPPAPRCASPLRCLAASGLAFLHSPADLR
jgi:serine/threonine protein kinase